MEIQKLCDQNVRIGKMVVKVCPGKTGEFGDFLDIQLLRAHIGKVVVGTLDPDPFVIFFFFQCNLTLYKNQNEPVILVQLVPFQDTSINWLYQACVAFVLE